MYQMQLPRRRLGHEPVVGIEPHGLHGFLLTKRRFFAPHADHPLSEQCQLHNFLLLWLDVRRRKTLFDLTDYLPDLFGHHPHRPPTNKPHGRIPHIIFRMQPGPAERVPHDHISRATEQRQLDVTHIGRCRVDVLGHKQHISLVVDSTSLHYVRKRDQECVLYERSGI